MKGDNIEFGTPNELKKYRIKKAVLIQEFKETEAGIPGLCKGRHDMRIVIIDGKIVWATIRQPKGKSFLANVAKGGSIKEIEIKDVPKSLTPIIKDLTKIFKKKYFNPIFSIDFGFENGKPFIYEINDQIGFPLPKMKKNIFVEELTKILIKKAEI